MRTVEIPVNQIIKGLFTRWMIGCIRHSVIVATVSCTHLHETRRHFSQMPTTRLSNSTSYLANKFEHVRGWDWDPVHQARDWGFYIWSFYREEVGPGPCMAGVHPVNRHTDTNNWEHYFLPLRWRVVSNDYWTLKRNYQPLSFAILFLNCIGLA